MEKRGPTREVVVGFERRTRAVEEYDGEWWLLSVMAARQRNGGRGGGLSAVRVAIRGCVQIHSCVSGRGEHVRLRRRRLTTGGLRRCGTSGALGGGCHVPDPFRAETTRIDAKR